MTDVDGLRRTWMASVTQAANKGPQGLGSYLAEITLFCFFSLFSNERKCRGRSGRGR